ncbi:MAG: hypothetical protein E6H63_04035 [Betaproteobacteria bacterium]|nr:MAG: hypothetical protein E6H63_04035 [Betaproteobacteria bacterium]
MNAKVLQKLGMTAGQQVLVNGTKLDAVLDEAVPDDCVRIAAAHPSTAALGAMFGPLTLERA